MAVRQTEVQLELHGGRKSREGNFRNGKCLVRNELTNLFCYIPPLSLKFSIFNKRNKFSQCK